MDAGTAALATGPPFEGRYEVLAESAYGVGLLAWIATLGAGRVCGCSALTRAASEPHKEVLP